jgi:hypothetical protein
MSSEEIEYYRQRVIAELELAEAAPHANIAAIHHELARHYAALVAQCEPMPTPDVIKGAQR